MAISIKEMIEQTREKYSLKLLSGQDALDYVVTWVHMTEDASVAEFFWGNEIVVTSGLFNQSELSLIRFVETLQEHRCAGLVINTGKYIEKIPSAVINYCREQNFPLLSMPWEMSITEFVRECCSLINRSSQEDADLAQEVLHIIMSPQDSYREQQHMLEQFHPEKGFVLIAIRADQAEEDLMMDQRRILRLHTAMRSFDFSYLSFRYEKQFLLLLNQSDIRVAEKVAAHVRELVLTALPEYPVYIGIGMVQYEFAGLTDCFHTAISAVRCAALQQIPVVSFRNMGFYQLLYSVPDDTLLISYYEETLRPLLEYDEKHNGCYVETLLRYLLSGGSVIQVAGEMYTHRNTVSYRMGKIRELLGNPLVTVQQQLPYLIAYHAGVILKRIPNFRQES